MTWWLGQSVSLLGTQFSLLAIPLTAALTLHATAIEMGVLRSMQSAPALIFGLAAGVWLDRVRRRPVMVWSQAASAAVLATVPLAALLGALSIAQLLAVAFVAGTAAMLYSLAQNSFLPTLAGTAHLVEANSKYQTSLTLAGLAGPGLAGFAVQLVTAPIAVAVDAGSFVVGMLTAAAVRREEAAPARRGDREVVAEVREGVEFIARDATMLSITIALIAANVGGALQGAVYALLFVVNLGVAPAELGLIFAAGSISSLLAAQVARPLVARVGVGRVMVAATAVFGAGSLLSISALLVPRTLVFPVLAGCQLIAGAGLMAYNVNQQSIRQAMTPDRLRGRVNSGVYVTVIGGQVLGALAGGAIGQFAGLPAAFAAGQLLLASCVLPTVFSPLPGLREVPQAAKP